MMEVLELMIAYGFDILVKDQGDLTTVDLADPLCAKWMFGIDRDIKPLQHRRSQLVWSGCTPTTGNN